MRSISLYLIATVAGLWLLIGVSMPSFAGLTLRPRASLRSSALQRAAVGGLQQAFFMGKRVDWRPALDASKAVEVGGEMPLGVRFERREDGASIS